MLGSGEGAHAAGDFLPDFGHADFSFRGIVIGRDRGVGGEAQVVIEAPAAAVAAPTVPSDTGVLNSSDIAVAVRDFDRY